jgi:hypothetical protein
MMDRQRKQDFLRIHTNRQVMVESCYSFYARVRAHGFLPVYSGQIVVIHTNEFTLSSTIDEQLALHYTGGSSDLTIREFVCGLGATSNHRIKVQAIPEDLRVQIPAGPLGA